MILLYIYLALNLIITVSFMRSPEFKGLMTPIDKIGSAWLMLCGGVLITIYTLYDIWKNR